MCKGPSQSVFLGGAAVGSLNYDNAAGNLVAVGKVGERPAVSVNRGEVDIEAGDVFDVASLQLMHSIQEYGEHVIGRMPSGAIEFHSLRQRLVFAGGCGFAAAHLSLIQFPAITVQWFSPPGVSAQTGPRAGAGH